jgi:hypothetical protein
MLRTDMREDPEMNATWIPVGGAVGLILLSLVALEVVSQGAQVERPSTGSWTIGDTPARSDDLLPVELAGMGGTGSAER